MRAIFKAGGCTLIVKNVNDVEEALVKVSETINTLLDMESDFSVYLDLYIWKCRIEGSVKSFSKQNCNPSNKLIVIK